MEQEPIELKRLSVLDGCQGLVVYAGEGRLVRRPLRVCRLLALMMLLWNFSIFIPLWYFSMMVMAMEG